MIHVAAYQPNVQLSGSEVYQQSFHLMIIISHWYTSMLTFMFIVSLSNIQFFHMLCSRREDRGQFAGSVVVMGHTVQVVDPVNQSDVSIQVPWSVLTNHRPVFRSRDLSWPITGQYLGHVICIDQSQASI